jgi:predicted metal-dependent phosphoesterase TrpH
MSSHHLDRRRLLLTGAGIATTAALTTFEPAAAGSTVTKTFKGHFSPADQEDWRYLPFRVPRGVRQIKVSYSYPPPNDTGVGFSTNVVDIGIFDPSGIGLGNAAGFRGWSGGARSWFRISRTSATPGYLPGPITPGRWRIALGPYQITSRVDYEVTVTLRFGRRGPAFVPAPAPTAVPGTGARWYRGDLHVHTVHSDGSQTQRQVLAYAQDAGLDFIGTSEHNTTSATETWGRHVPDGFLVISGEEVTTRAGHWLATGLPAGTWIDWRYRPEDDQLARFTQQVRDLGGLSIAAHPNIPVPSIRWDFDRKFKEMDAVEVWNGAWSGLNAAFNTQAVARWHDLLSEGIFKPAVGNSDTHKQAQQIGLAQTVVRAESLSTEAIIAAYRAGHSWIAESSVVDLTFTATLGAVIGECGDRVPSGPDEEVAVHLQASGVPGCVARLLGPGLASYGLATADEGGQLILDATVPGGTAFVRAEVRRGPQPSDPMVALTNPILLTPAG